jgi:hypothetical protein
MLMTAGHQFFSTMHLLHTVQIFAVSQPVVPDVNPFRWVETRSLGNINSRRNAADEPTDNSSELDLHEIAVSWNRFCPHVREVQLRADLVWRRIDETGEWLRKEVESVPD